MFGNILIVTDNTFIAKAFDSIVKDLNITESTISYAISPFSDLLNYWFLPDVFQIDMRNDKEIYFLIREYDLIISAHCKQLFPKKLIEKVKCINVHPGYNPMNRGWYPQVFSILNNKVIGATIHEIDEKLDHGLIIDRMSIAINSWDTSLSLYNRIVEAEIFLFKKNLKFIVSNKYKTITPEEEGQLFLKKDFKKLLCLNLQEQMTLEKAITILRALTHGEYNNAFFIDVKSKRKVYVKITLEVEDE